MASRSGPYNVRARQGHKGDDASLEKCCKEAFPWQNSVEKLVVIGMDLFSNYPVLQSSAAYRLWLDTEAGHLRNVPREIYHGQSQA